MLNSRKPSVTSKPTRGSEQVNSSPPSELLTIITALEDKKAVDARVLDVREIVSYADFLVVCSGTSSTHVHALVAGVEDAFPSGQGPVYVNSSKDDSWWILDFVEVVVHIFKDETRHYYDLERLWGDAPQIKIGG